MFAHLDAKRREQTPQVIARFVVVGLFVALWLFLLAIGMPMPVPFLLALLAEAALFLGYWRAVFHLSSVRAIELTHYAVLAAEIVVFTFIVYFIGGLTNLGAFAYVFGLIWATAFLDLRRGLVYTGGVALAFTSLALLEGSGAIPHYVYLDQGPLRYTDPDFVVTYIVGVSGVFFGVYLWVYWVGHQLRRERDAAIRARAELQRANEELESRVRERTAELEHAVGALRESEGTLRATIESTADGILVVHSNGYVAYANKLFADMWRIPEELLEARHVRPLLAYVVDQVEDPETFMENIRQQVGTDEERCDPVTFKDGRTVEQHSSPLLHGNEVIGRVVSFRDITERKRAEEVLRESEERFRTLVRDVDAIVWEADALTWKFTFVSEQAERVLGYPVEQWLTEVDFWVSHIHPDDREWAANFCAQATAEAKDHELDYRMVAQDGRVVWLHDIVRVMVDESGHARQLRGVMFDITAHKRAEEALRESEARVRVLNEQVPAVLWTADTELRFTSSQGTGLQSLGLQPGQVVGMTLFEYFQVDDPDFPPIEAHRRAFRGESVRYETVWNERTFDSRVEPLRGPDGAIIGVIGVATDITERKQAEEALEWSLRAERERARRDSLTGVLNHAAIVDELRRVIDSSAGPGARHAVAMVDVDALKVVNDTYGHQVGDAVLGVVAKALSTEGAIVGRYGGDEFVVVLENTTQAGAERYRRQVLKTLAEVELSDTDTGGIVPIVVSIGLAVYPDQAQTIDELIRLSDSTMYASRRRRPLARAALRPGHALSAAAAADLMSELVPLLTTSGDLDSKLRQVAERLSVGAGYDAVNFNLYGPVPGESLARNTFGAQLPKNLAQAWDRQGRQGRGEIRALLKRTRRPLILGDIANDARLTEPQRAMLQKAGLRSVVIAPMIWDEEAIGALSAASRRDRAFGPADAQFLTDIATQITALVRMATMIEELRSGADRSAQEREATVLLLAATVEAYDPVTQRHIENVRALAEALARELGHDEAAARELGLAAVLHDIGKVRLPDALLTRSDQLTGEEWELMKLHASWGAQFLDARPGFELAAAIARSHHERWDGKGYPDGLAGDAIPEAVAIVSVADAFDAMISDRPYRRRRSAPQAVREIVACSGAQFSPRVVEALLRLEERKLLPRPSSRTLKRAA